MDDKDELTTTPFRKRSGSGGKRYCALCQKHEKEILDNGFEITLHRVPSRRSEKEKARRQLWLRGLKLHRPNLKISESTRVCILHFENHTYVHGVSVPKYYNLQKRTVPSSNRPRRRPLVLISNNTPNIDSSQDEVYYATKLEQPVPDLYFDEMDNCETVEIAAENHLPEPYVNSSASEHGYSLPPDECKFNSASCQTEQQPQMGSPKPEDLENNNEKTRFYTGFPNYATFMLFFHTFLKHGAANLNYWEGQKRSLNEHVPSMTGRPGPKRKLRPLDEFFMVCIRLRLGLLQEHLSDMFGVSVRTVSRVMNTWINFMYDHMKSLIPWPTKEQILSNLPKCFVDMQDVRIVVDATEFFCEKPSSLAAQNLTWSEYKHHNTIKVLVGVSPNGLVTFISSVWGGHTSDRHITQEDGHLLIPKLEPGDIILADKGFTVADLLPPNIGLNMPPFVSRTKQMTTNEFFKTQQIASSRIVVEMKMEQIKNFRLLQTILPISEVHLAEQIIVICAAITNLYGPLLK